MRARERALHVAEQLALDQLRRDGGAVDLDERPLGPMRQPVDRTRDQLLAGPVLAGDQHARVGRCDLLDAVEQRADGEAAADDLVAALDLAAQPRVLLDEAALLQRVADREQQAIGVERLLQEVVGAAARRLDRRLDGAVAADHDDVRVRIVRGSGPAPRARPCAPSSRP
jgi:hypothetical protein